MAGNSEPLIFAQGKKDIAILPPMANRHGLKVPAGFGRSLSIAYVDYVFFEKAIWPLNRGL